MKRTAPQKEFYYVACIACPRIRKFQPKRFNGKHFHAICSKCFHKDVYNKVKRDIGWCRKCEGQIIRNGDAFYCSQCGYGKDINELLRENTEELFDMAKQPTIKEDTPPAMPCSEEEAGIVALWDARKRKFLRFGDVLTWIRGDDYEPSLY